MLQIRNRSQALVLTIPHGRNYALVVIAFEPAHFIIKCASLLCMQNQLKCNAIQFNAYE